MPRGMAGVKEILIGSPLSSIPIICSPRFLTRVYEQSLGVFYSSECFRSIRTVRKCGTCSSHGESRGHSDFLNTHNSRKSFAARGGPGHSSPSHAQRQTRPTRKSRMSRLLHPLVHNNRPQRQFEFLFMYRPATGFGVQADGGCDEQTSHLTFPQSFPLRETLPASGHGYHTKMRPAQYHVPM